MNWQFLKMNEKYQINTEYPYAIRKLSTKRVIHDIKSQNGLMVKLGEKLYQKHRVVMQQFNPLKSDDSKMIVHRINGNKNDYHLSNLIWMTSTEFANVIPQTFRHGETIEYFEKLPDGASPVLKYNDHEFNNLYFHDNEFYVTIRDGRFKKLVKSSGYLTPYYGVKDTNGKRVIISYEVFKSKYLV
jgi:hypothetical protein